MLKRGHVIIPWVVAHASDSMVRYKVGDDGKTVHARWKGNGFKRNVNEIGLSNFRTKKNAKK